MSLALASRVSDESRASTSSTPFAGAGHVAVLQIALSCSQVRNRLPISLPAVTEPEAVMFPAAAQGSLQLEAWKWTGMSTDSPRRPQEQEPTDRG